MLLTPEAKLAEKIVRFLAENPASPAPSMLAKLRDGGRRYSRRAMYKELRRLQDQAVVIQSSARYSLRLGWLVELERLVETAHRRAIESVYTTLPLDAKDTRTVWRFPDLRHVDDYWIQVALALFDHTREPAMFYWIRHSWFSMAHPEKDDEFQRALRRRRRLLYLAIGGDTFLDRLPAPAWAPDVYRPSFKPSPFQGSRLGSITAIGEYVVTVRLDARLNEALDTLYSRVQAESDLTVEAHRTLFATKGSCTLILEHAPSKAASYLARFRRFFGVARGGSGLAHV